MKLMREFDFRTPTMPNFLISTTDRDAKLSVAELSEVEVELVINAWARAFRAHCSKRRAERVLP